MWVHRSCLASMWILRIWTQDLLQAQQILQPMEPSPKNLVVNFYINLFRHLKRAGRLGSWLDSRIKGQPQNQWVYVSFLLVLHKPQLCHLFPTLSLSVFLLPLPFPSPCLFQPFAVYLSVLRDKGWIAILKGLVKASLIEEVMLEMTAREPKVRVFQSPRIESAKTQSVKPPAWKITPLKPGHARKPGTKSQRNCPLAFWHFDTTASTKFTMKKW